MKKEAKELEALIKEKFNVVLSVCPLRTTDEKDVLAFVAITQDILAENNRFKHFIDSLSEYVIHDIDYVFYNPFILDLNKCSIEMIKNLAKLC